MCGHVEWFAGSSKFAIEAVSAPNAQLNIMHEPADGGSATQLLTMKPKGAGEANSAQVVFKQGLKVEPGQTLDVTDAFVEGLDIKIDESLIGPSVTETLNGNKALVTDAINNAEIKPASVDSTGEIKARSTWARATSRLTVLARSPARRWRRRAT